MKLSDHENEAQSLPQTGYVKGNTSKKRKLNKNVWNSKHIMLKLYEIYDKIQLHHCFYNICIYLL